MPRPLAFEEPASESIRVRVTPTQKQLLQQVAAENSVDLSGVIRDAVDTFVADYREAQVFRGTKPEGQ